MQKVELWESKDERDRIEQLSNLYALVKATEHLETAYGNGAVQQIDYERECTQLINQYRVQEKAGIAGDVENFFRDYNLKEECPRAYERLVKNQSPLIAPSGTETQAAEIAKTVQYFITALDILALNQRAVDEVQPRISDIINSLLRIRSVSPDFEGIVKMRHWLISLNNKKAHIELSEDEVRQLKFDLDSSYSAFMALLDGK